MGLPGGFSGSDFKSWGGRKRRILFAWDKNASFFSRGKGHEGEKGKRSINELRGKKKEEKGKLLVLRKGGEARPSWPS